MAKLKKCQQVEIYLNALIESDDFNLEDLAALKYQDIVAAKELEGVGDRTISNVLNAFKAKNGVARQENRSTKKKTVEEYLNGLLERDEISLSELMHLSYTDIKDAEELADVGKTTITCALAAFKKKKGKKTFETGVLDFLAQECSPAKNPSETHPEAKVSQKDHGDDQTSEIKLDSDNVRILKRMIHEFQQIRNIDDDKKRYELRELKHALQHVGINHARIVRLYWEDISRDFMNEKILSGRPADLSVLKVSNYV